PGGGVATASKWMTAAVERAWGPLAAKLALATGADVLPVFFHGQNSRLFQIAANIHQVLKYSLLLHEVRNKIGTSVRVKVGQVIPNPSLQEMGNPQAVTATLKRLIQELSLDQRRRKSRRHPRS